MAEIKIPAVGESITEATISEWKKKDGDLVQRDEILLVLETDKASVEVVAENSGKLSVKTKEGETVPIGSIVGEIDTSVAVESAATKTAPPPPPTKAPPKAPPKGPTNTQAPHLSPAVNRLVTESNINPQDISPSGPKGNITKGDVLNQLNREPAKAAPTALPKAKVVATGERQTRETMSKLRQTIARRLVEAQHTAAILTTFNEIDMTAVMDLRSKYKEAFKQKHSVNLGFMGFFTKAVIDALKAYPRVNACIDGNDIIYNNYYNVGVAVGTEKGLVVPVIQNADQLSLAEIELSIKHYAEKARDGKISLNDLTDGTFTISNGGVYGSLLSTPILNPPQSGILGLHKIQERPIAKDGQVVIRPMMYVALSYDHRMVDGKEAVSFLVHIKESLEYPGRLLLDL